MIEFRPKLLDPWHYFAQCPSCRREGTQRGVEMGNRQKTLTYWCPECQKAWTVSGPHDEQWHDVGAPAHSPTSPSTDAK